jgi:NAD(P)-dependent dehydrogenase (short-subunit alcohol dehydrogenase family)
MAVALADAGADIAGAARTVDQLEETAALVRGRGRKFLIVPTDVTDSAQCNALVSQAIAEFGRIDVLINNAGGGGAGRGKTLAQLSDDDWRQGLDTNMTSCFYMTRAVITHMLDRGAGRIVNITSGFGIRGGRENWMYSTAKAGMINFTRSLAVTYGAQGIQACCLAPGFFPHLYDVEQARHERAKYIPLGRFGLDPEIGALTAFLASDAAGYMNGETVVLDGGGIVQSHAPTGFAPSIPLRS